MAKVSINWSFGQSSEVSNQSDIVIEKVRAVKELLSKKNVVEAYYQCINYVNEHGQPPSHVWFSCFDDVIKTLKRIKSDYSVPTALEIYICVMCLRTGALTMCFSDMAHSITRLEQLLSEYKPNGASESEFLMEALAQMYFSLGLDLQRRSSNNGPDVGVQNLIYHCYKRVASTPVAKNVAPALPLLKHKELWDDFLVGCLDVRIQAACIVCHTQQLGLDDSIGKENASGQQPPVWKVKVRQHFLDGSLSGSHTKKSLEGVFLHEPKLRPPVECDLSLVRRYTKERFSKCANDLRLLVWVLFQLPDESSMLIPDAILSDARIEFIFEVLRAMYPDVPLCGAPKPNEATSVSLSSDSLCLFDLFAFLCGVCVFSAVRHHSDPTKQRRAKCPEAVALFSRLPACLLDVHASPTAHQRKFWLLVADCFARNGDARRRSENIASHSSLLQKTIEQLRLIPSSKANAGLLMPQNLGLRLAQAVGQAATQQPSEKEREAIEWALGFWRASLVSPTGGPSGPRSSNRWNESPAGPGRGSSATMAQWALFPADLHLDWFGCLSLSETSVLDAAEAKRARQFTCRGWRWVAAQLTNREEALEALDRVCHHDPTACLMAAQLLMPDHRAQKSTDRVRRYLSFGHELVQTAVDDPVEREQLAERILSEMIEFENENDDEPTNEDEGTPSDFSAPVNVVAADQTPLRHTSSPAKPNSGSSLSRSVARNNLFRNAQAVPHNTPAMGVRGPAPGSRLGVTPERLESQLRLLGASQSQMLGSWQNTVVDLSRQLSECQVELNRSRDMNQQFSAQLQQVTRKLDEASLELQQARLTNERLSQALVDWNRQSREQSTVATSKEAVVPNEGLAQAVANLSSLVTDIRAEMRILASQGQAAHTDQSKSLSLLEQLFVLMRSSQLQQQQPAAPPPQPPVDPTMIYAAMATFMQQQQQRAVLLNRPNAVQQMNAATYGYPPVATMSPVKQVPPPPQHQQPQPSTLTTTAPTTTPVKPPTQPFVVPPNATSPMKPPAQLLPRSQPSLNLMDKFKPKPGAWECETCMVSNGAEATVCSACQTPKPGSGKPPAASQPAAKPIEGVKFSFQSNNAPSNQFTFGAPSTTPSTKPTFSFGMTGAKNTAPATTTGAPPPSFTFGQKTTPVTSKQPTLSFGDAGKPTNSFVAPKPANEFNFQFKPSQTTSPVKPPAAAAEKSKDDSDDEVVQCDEEKLNFKPVLEKLPDQVEVKTGEEDEEVLFDHRGRLYRCRQQKWAQRGTGPCRILRHKETGRVRLVMRQEQTLKVCCNHQIAPEMKLQPMGNAGPDGRQTTWTWWAVDFSEVGTPQDTSNGQGTRETLAIRFGTTEAVDNFYKAFMSATAAGGASSPVKSTTEKSQEAETAEKDEVEIVSVTEASEKQVKRAEALQLPKNFFASENGPKSGESDHMTEAELREEDELLAEAQRKSLTPQKAVAEAEEKEPAKPNLFAGITPAATSQEKESAATNAADKPSLFGSLLNATTPKEGLFSSKLTGFGTGEKTGIFGSPSSTTNVIASKETDKPGLFSGLAAVGDKGGLFGSQPPSTTLFGSLKPAGGECEKTSLFGGLLQQAKTPENKAGTTAAYVPSFAGMKDFSQLGGTSPIKKPDQADGAIVKSWASTAGKVLFEGTKAEVSGDADDQEEADDQEHDPHYDAIVSLPEVEVKTGEEDEICLFLRRCKVYRMHNREWKERGTGEMKVLVEPLQRPSDVSVGSREELPASRDSDLGQVKRARLLMRREQVLKLCVNQPLNPDCPPNFTRMGDTRNRIIWKAQDFSSGEWEVETLCLKFKTDEDCEQFQKAVNRALAIPRQINES